MWGKIQLRTSASVLFTLLLLNAGATTRAKGQLSPEACQPQERHSDRQLARPTAQNGEHKSRTFAKEVIPRFAYVPNRSSFTVTAFAVDPDSGALSTVPGSPFPTGREPISVAADPSGRFLYVADLASF